MLMTMAREAPLMKHHLLKTGAPKAPSLPNSRKEGLVRTCSTAANGCSCRAPPVTRTYSVPRQAHGKDPPVAVVDPSAPAGGTDRGAEDVEMLRTAHGRREWTKRQVDSRCEEFLHPIAVDIFVGTWNVCGNSPERDLDCWLFEDGVQYDIYVVALQEVQKLSGLSAVITDADRGRCWTVHVEKALRTRGEYVCLGARQMVGILLTVFVRRKHLPHVKDVMVTELGTGLMYVGGNKGAVAMRFQFYEQTFCFVSCHLAAQQENVARRNQDFREILRRTEFGRDAESGLSSVLSSVLFGRDDVWTIDDHDLVVFAGDFNYRIDLESRDVMEAIRSEDWARLQANDQLTRSRRTETAFDYFREAEINFAPTYKTNKKQEGYALHKDGHPSRPPSWTDRVLFRSSSGGRRNDRDHHLRVAPAYSVECGRYRRHEVLTSDHRPVSMSFHATVVELDRERRAKVLSEVYGTLSPDLQFVPEVLRLPPLRFGSSAATALEVRNNGRIPVAFELRREDQPAWLATDPAGALRAEAGETVRLRVCVRADGSSGPYFPALATSVYSEGGSAVPVEGVLTVCVEGDVCFEIKLEGKLTPSVLGVPYRLLLKRDPGPEAHVPGLLSILFEALGRSEAALPAPETRLAECELTALLGRIERERRVPEGSSPAAVRRLLLEIFRFCPDRLVPPRGCELFRSAGTREDAVRALAGLPEPQRSVLRAWLAALRAATAAGVDVQRTLLETARASSAAARATAPSDDAATAAHSEDPPFSEDDLLLARGLGLVVGDACTIIDDHDDKDKDKDKGIDDKEKDKDKDKDKDIDDKDKDKDKDIDDKDKDKDIDDKDKDKDIDDKDKDKDKDIDDKDKDKDKDDKDKDKDDVSVPTPTQNLTDECVPPTN